MAPGALFFALKGEKEDGNKFRRRCPGTWRRGHRQRMPAPDQVLPNRLAAIQPGARALATLATVSANFYGRPANALQIVGITGTNGKTTTSYLVDSILRAGGTPTGLFGTIAVARREAAARPSTPPLNRSICSSFFAEVRDEGGKAVVMETSSHALAMDRFWGCHFAAAVFTNLTRDHLDYHKSFEEYFAAKRRLFEGAGAGPADVGVINTDDPYGKQLEGIALRTFTYGLKNGARIKAEKYPLSFSGLEFTAQTPAGKIEVQSKLVGKINVYNILAAIGAGIALDVNSGAIERGIRDLEAVPGRFERIAAGQPFLVIVDYAHTDDALRNLISTARELSADNRIITLFGAGGDRDRTKRPLMGEAAGTLSDIVVLTSDNPRSEDPLRIINDVLVGLQKTGAKHFVEADREKAIEIAMNEAKPGDIVLLAGKGHETYQVLRDGPVEFDDREIARRILRGHGYSAAKS